MPMLRMRQPHPLQLRLQAQMARDVVHTAALLYAREVVYPSIEAKVQGFALVLHGGVPMVAKTTGLAVLLTHHHAVSGPGQQGSGG